jgi:DNA-binding transcriptional MocR family regulator
LAQRLADAIAADVEVGTLMPGHQLPTQRALARQLGVTPGTVNRGYAIAERAGLVRAEVGRGTFVFVPRDTGIHEAGVAREASAAIELGLNYPAGTEAETALGEALAQLGHGQPGRQLMGLSPYAGRAEHRIAGARWLERVGLSVTGADVVLCTGVQHGLAAALAALTAPGDVVLTETLTSPGVKAVAATQHLRLVGVAGDHEGLLPDELASACRATGSRVLYTMPTLHSPTTTTMPDSRRRSIAEVMNAQGLIALEDDAWGFLAEGKVTPLRQFAPDRVVYLTSVAKSLAPGLRVGYAVAPASLQHALTSSIGAMTWAAPLMAEIVTRWIGDGTAASIAAQRRRNATERQRLAESILGAGPVRSALPTFHLWLPIPEPWRVGELVTHAAAMGVALAPPEFFTPDRAPAPHAIRVCTGTEADITRLEHGLRVLAQMLRSGPSGYSNPGA